MNPGSRGIRTSPPRLHRGEFAFASIFCVVGLLCCLAPTHAFAQAQAINATLSGSILDATGASVPGAAVTLADPTTSFSRTQTTQQEGRYSFTLIPAGTYSLRVAKEGFRAYVQSGIILGAGQGVSQDITLELGAVTQEVQVTSSAPLLNTSNANMESSVSAREIVELPLNWRTPFGLVALDSQVQNSIQQQGLYDGVSFAASEQDASFFNFGGSRPGTNAFLLDGHWNTMGDWNSLMYAPSVDEVAEFKMQTHAFTVQYGWSMGNIINVITKGGTNKFHGNVFEFLRNSALDANNFMNNRFGTKKSDFKRNQFGASAGGPLYIPKLYEQTDRTFIFGLYEGQRQSTPLATVITIPTASMKAGNFSALLGSQIGTDALGRPIFAGEIYNPISTRPITAGQLDSDPTYGTGLMATSTGFIRNAFGATAANGWTPNNDVSGLIDPVSQNLVGYYPDPTNSNLTNNFTSSSSLPLTTDRWTVRVDHNIGSQTRLFGRYSRELVDRYLTGKIWGENPAGPATRTPNNRFDAGFALNHVFDPTTVMSYTFGTNRWPEGFNPQGFGFQPSTLGLPTVLDSQSMFPTIGIQDMFGLGAGNWNFTPREVVTNAVDFTKVHGNHTMTTGFMNVMLYTYTTFLYPFFANFNRGMTNGPDPTAAPTNTGFGFASFLLGTGSGGDYTVLAEAAYIKKYFGWYFQDEWKVTRKLTASLGIRYDIQTPTTDRFDRFGSFYPSGSNPLSQEAGIPVTGYFDYVGGSNPRGIHEAAYNNIAPRLGLTYRITDKLLWRGGFGIFFAPALQNGDYQGLTMYGFTQTTPWVATVDGITPNNLLSDPFPTGLIQPVGKGNGQLTQVGQSLSAVMRPRTTPYVTEWMGGFQYAFTPDDNLDVTYIGNQGTKLIFTNHNINQLTESDLALGSSLFDQVTNPFYSAFQSLGLPSACGLNQPTVTRGQLLRQFPQYCSVNEVQRPAGGSDYHAVSMTYNHRWSKGLHMLASFTVSKYTDQSAGPDSWLNPSPVGLQYAHNLTLEKSLDAGDIPKALVVSWVYDLPFGRGKKFGNTMNKFADGVLGGWQVAGIATFKDGFPIGPYTALNNSNSLGNSQRPDVVGDPHSSSPNVDEWFNTSAFAQPAAFTFGNASRELPNLRAPGLNNWDLNLQKNWRWQEKLRIQFRTEFYNAFNTAWLHAPNVVYGSSTFGQITVAHFARSIQMGLKIYW